MTRDFNTWSGGSFIWLLTTSHGNETSITILKEEMRANNRIAMYCYVARLRPSLVIIPLQFCPSLFPPWLKPQSSFSGYPSTWRHLQQICWCLPATSRLPWHPHWSRIGNRARYLRKSVSGHDWGNGIKIRIVYVPMYVFFSISRLAAPEASSFLGTASVEPISSSRRLG